MEEISSKIKKILEAEEIKVKKLSLLAGDASNRKYFECFLSKKNYVIMYDNDEKNLKDFIKVTKILKKFVIVPSIIYDFSKQSILVLENFGPTKYAQIITKKNRKKIYKLAVDTIFDIQKIRNPDLPKYTLSMFIDESNLFFDWYLPLFFGKKKTKEIKKNVKKNLIKLYKQLINSKKCFVHRDFHVQNLMKVGNRIGLIDTQDALVGSQAYDLASLIDDVRIKTSSKLKKQIYNYYLKRNPNINKDNFLLNFNILSVQRSLKIIGIFSRLYVRDKKDKYLKLIPHAWKLLESRMESDVFSELKKNLDKNISKTIRKKVINK